MIDYVLEVTAEDENSALGAIPDDDVQKVVIIFNGDSSSGPIGLSKKFYQVYWNIMGIDIVRMVQDFFSSNSLPKFVTSTNLVLISKKVNVQTFSDTRPIILSNFLNKILSKIIYDRIEGFFA